MGLGSQSQHKGLNPSLLIKRGEGHRCVWLEGQCLLQADSRAGGVCVCVHGLLLRYAQLSKAIAISYWSRKLIPLCMTGFLWDLYCGTLSVSLFCFCSSSY